MRYTTFIKKQNYYNTKVLITQSFKESIELRKRTREKRRRGNKGQVVRIQNF